MAKDCQYGQAARQPGNEAWALTLPSPSGRGGQSASFPSRAGARHPTRLRPLCMRGGDQPLAHTRGSVCAAGRARPTQGASRCTLPSTRRPPESARECQLHSTRQGGRRAHGNKRRPNCRLPIFDLRLQCHAVAPNRKDEKMETMKHRNAETPKRKCHGVSLTKKACIAALFSCATLWHCMGCTSTENVLTALVEDVQAGVAGIVEQFCGAEH